MCYSPFCHCEQTEVLELPACRLCGGGYDVDADDLLHDDDCVAFGEELAWPFTLVGGRLDGKWITTTVIRQLYVDLESVRDSYLLAPGRDSNRRWQYRLITDKGVV